MCLLCFTLIHWRLRGLPWVLPTKSQFRGLPNISWLPPVFSSSSSRLMQDNMSCVKIISVLFGAHSEDGKGIPVAKEL